MWAFIIALIAVVWLAVTIIGVAFNILGKLIWLAILVTLISIVWGYIKQTVMKRRFDRYKGP